MKSLQSEAYKGYTINVYQDECDCNPRTEWDNFGHMVCFHKQYNLGDKTSLTSDMFNSWGELEKYLYEEEQAAIVITLYMIDHSGISIRAGRDFSDCDPGSWDSGAIGFIYCSKEDIRKDWNIKHVTKTYLEMARDILFSEVKTYNDYLTGNVYGYVVTDREGEEIDSCCGYFGDPEKSGLLESARAAIDYHIQDCRKKHFEQVKTWIRNSVPLEKRSPLVC